MRTSLSLLLVSIVMSLGSVASLSAAQISLNVAPHSTGNVSYVSGGQLINFAVYNHHPSLNQFVPYSNTSGTPYSCNPLSWLSYMPVPLGQPLMRSNTQRGLTVSCQAQCGSIMYSTAFGDEPLTAYCADGSARTWVAGPTTDRLYWTCGSNPAQQCRANKGCTIEGHTPGNPTNQLDTIALTMYGGGGNVGSVKVGHNKSIMFGNSCMLGSQTYDENTLVRCVGGKLYPHMGSTTAACTTPLSMPYIVEGAYAWNLTVYSSKPTNSISSAPVYWFDTNGLTPGILSVQGGSIYCDANTGCPASCAKDPNNNAAWMYGLYSGGTNVCPYNTGSSSTF